MPSSTLWRRRPQDIDLSRRSPSPPTQYIEPLSPSLDSPPSALDRISHEHQSYRHSLQGLGVSYDTAPDDRLDFGRPRELYLDHNGEAHVGNSRPAVNDNQHSGFDRIRNDYGRPHTRDGFTPKRSRGKGHTRSGSTIDDLASAAIATSPTFTNWSPSHCTVRPATSYIYSQSFQDGERPHKRIRSEKLPSREWSPREDGHLETQMSTEQRM